MKRHRFFSRVGFTLAELTVAMAVGIVVSGLSFMYLRTGSLLFAKNVTVNFSNNDLRGALDSISDRVQSAINVPTLIDTTGAAVTTTTSAGVYYDRLLGEPYVVTQPGGAGLAASATSVIVTRSTNLYASPPLPVAGDVLLIDGADSSMRPIVSSVVVAAPVGNLQVITITFTAQLGIAISWDATQAKMSKLIRREALIDMANGTRRELRRYNSFETTTNLSDATKYTVLTRMAGTQTGEVTPFSISTVGLDKMLNIDFRERTTGFENVMAGKEVNGFSNYMRVQCVLASRQRPKN